jgi:hypothetical protein
MPNHFAFRYEYPVLPGQLLSDIEVISLDDTARHNVYKGVWDTGATLTMITPKIFSELKLPYRYGNSSWCKQPNASTRRAY